MMYGKITSLIQKGFLGLLGIFLCVCLLEIGLRTAGFILTYLQEQGNLRSLRERGDYVIMCLGESTTALGGGDAYPRQLEKVLNEKDIGVKFSVLNKGITATTTTHLVSRLEEFLDAYKPDIVVAMTGINDDLSMKTYRAGDGTQSNSFFTRFKVYKLTKLLQERILCEPGKAIRRPHHAVDETVGSPESASSRLNLSRPGEVDKSLKRGREENSSVCREAARELRLQGFEKEAERMYQKAIEINPGNDAAWAELGQLYKWQGRASESETLCKEAIGINPDNIIAISELGMLAKAKGRWEEAEELFLKAFELDPASHFPFSELVAHYTKQKRFKKVEELCRRVIEIDPENDRAWGTLALCSESQGKRIDAEEYFKKASEIRSIFFNYATAENYRKIKEEVSQRGIRFVCAQYPMRKLEHLKRMFSNQNGIIFVDNEEIFKKAVEREGYEVYFSDNFAGDFGHCTRKGNRLLAENIARVILEQVIGINNQSAHNK